ncbi:hypothetical protein IMY05_004G0161800 [Salix suchowensis]|nr:hypothetical protein IMY05_004G0161800 [Salix suchowensis]
MYDDCAVTYLERGRFAVFKFSFFKRCCRVDSVEFHNPFNLSSSVQSLQSAVLETRVLILAVTTAFQRLRRATFLRRSTGKGQQWKTCHRFRS